MKGNTQLLFIGVLVFVFPIFFIHITQGFFDTANANITTSEKRRVGLIHDSILIAVSEPTMSSAGVQNLLVSQNRFNDDIKEVRVVTETNEGYLITNSLQTDVIGTIDTNTAIYENALGSTDTSLIFEETTKGYRIWFAVRKVVQPGEPTQFIFSEHSLRTIDALMAARQQQSYFGLTAIFVFLIALAYWISRQVFWQRKHARLERDLAERDLFTNMITHEFRSPLTAIKGYTSFLHEAKGLSEEERRYVTTIDTATARLLALVNDFLEVARIQSGKLSVEKKPVMVHDTIIKVLDVVRPLASTKGLELRFSPTLKPIVFQTDEKRLSQILQNMITNSIKYTETGSVEITTEQNSVSFTIRIKDTGTGISAEDQTKLFTPFARVGGVEKSTTVGTGLGMWITRQLVDLLEGTIGIESIKGVGTHAVITFKTR
jgi:signal transduction histidine kinase